MFLPGFLLEGVNVFASAITALMMDGARLGADTGLVVDVSIGAAATTAIMCLLFACLIYGHKLPGIWKWAALPLISALGIFVASLGGQAHA